MSSLQRRLERLEQHLKPTDCACAVRPCWMRLANHFGELLPDDSPQPDPINCPMHGRMFANVIVFQAVEAENGKPAPGYRKYQHQEPDVACGGDNT